MAELLLMLLIDLREALVVLSTDHNFHLSVEVIYNKAYYISILPLII